MNGYRSPGPTPGSDLAGGRQSLRRRARGPPARYHVALCHLGRLTTSASVVAELGLARNALSYVPAAWRRLSHACGWQDFQQSLSAVHLLLTENPPSIDYARRHAMFRSCAQIAKLAKAASVT